MSNRIVVLINAGESQISGLLAGEALKKAAADRGLELYLEVKAEGETSATLSRELGTDDLLLLVGHHSENNFSFSERKPVRASLTEVLEDAGRVLDNLTGGKQTMVPGGSVSASKRVVAVTSCPTGIAHTFMAAEGLQQAAAELGYEIRVETQGSVGAGTPLTAEEIAAADLVIIAADRDVDRSRFNGKMIFSSATKPAITAGKDLIKKAFAEAELQPGAAETAGSAEPTAKKAGPYKHLMTGVSFMLPFVVAGGLLIALAFAIGGIDANAEKNLGTFANILFQIGANGGFALIVPALAGYIAFSIADRPGLAPGMIGGMLAAHLGAGFLGGIVAGFIAGYGTDWLNRIIKLPKGLAGLKPLLILPFLGTALTGLIMFYVVGKPVAEILSFLTEWLKGLQGTRSFILGLLLGGMMAVDLGGPVNKAAYAFSVGLIDSQIYTPMAATMAAGMTPPLAAALATRLFKNRFTPQEREAAPATAVLGLAFVSEGAIPFAAADPFRVIPSFIVGSAVTGAISMLLKVELKVPHGGIFVLPIPGAVTHLGGYLLALVAGTLISVAMLGLLKKPKPESLVAHAVAGASAK